jgi:hypothetical protein
LPVRLVLRAHIIVAGTFLSLIFYNQPPLCWSSPQYLSAPCHPYKSSRFLGSLYQLLLNCPRVHPAIGLRACRSAAPQVWFSMPLHIRPLPSTSASKLHHRTFCFSHSSSQCSFCVSDSHCDHCNVYLINIPIGPMSIGLARLIVLRGDVWYSR